MNFKNWYDQKISRRRNKEKKYTLTFTTDSFSSAFSFKTKAIIFLVVLAIYGSLVGTLGMTLAEHSQFLANVWNLFGVGMGIWLFWKYYAYSRGRSHFYERELKNVWLSNDLVVFNQNDAVVEELLAVVQANSPKSNKPYCCISIYKQGNKFQDKIENLGDKLSSAIGLPLMEEEDTVKFHVFNFQPEPEQDVINPQVWERQDTAEEVYFYNRNSWDFHENFSSLVTGVSGSGKSYFTYFLLTSFLNNHVYDSDTHSYHNNRIYVIDPKMSDLYKIMSNTSGSSEHYYGTSKADAFRIVREYQKILNERQKAYSELSGVYDSLLIDTGHYAPYLLVLEEFSALSASFSKKEREDFEDILKEILFKGRQLGMGVMIITQKFDSQVASTAIRENLNYKFLLGQHSSPQLIDTVFGQHSDVPTPAQVKGAGLAGIESQGGESFKFIAPKLSGDLFETIEPIWRRAFKDEDETEEV
jgi:DNA segregation ATPase FtsK/SpoIIIE and related proteins